MPSSEIVICSFGLAAVPFELISKPDAWIGAAKYSLSLKNIELCVSFKLLWKRKTVWSGFLLNLEFL